MWIWCISYRSIFTIFSASSFMLIVIFISLILPTDIRRVKRPGVGGSGPLPHTWRGVLILTDRLPAALFHLSLTLEEASPFFLPFRVKSPAGISFFPPPPPCFLERLETQMFRKKKSNQTKPKVGDFGIFTCKTLRGGDQKVFLWLQLWKILESTLLQA